jgi:hypothetical protein
MASSMKNFTTAAAEIPVEERPEEEVFGFQINGEGDYEAMIPTEDQIALFVSAFAGNVGTGESVAGMKDFAREVFTRPTYKTLMGKINSRHDPMELTDLQGIFSWLIEEATARPTPPRSDSTGSRAATTKRSTGTTRRATSTRSS